MPTLPQAKAELESLRASLFAPFQEAKAKGDKAEMDRLQGLAGEIDDLLDDLAILGLQTVAIKLEAIRAKIEAATRKASSWPFGFAEAPEDHERPFREVEKDTPAARPRTPSAGAETVPKPAAGASEDYRELWRTAKILPEWQKAADAIAKKIIANQSRYAAVVAGTEIPWWFVAVVHAMECSLRFDQHLHNGDPLTARTVNVPRGRPPSSPPPFTWEVSARDAIGHEKLDLVRDWSLPNVLFHWHRYNGINNEYKRRGIPTPYLWSGSQHYRKGKYVADGVFDPEKVSAQVGAAVILKALVALEAVTIDNRAVAVETNPAAATQHVPSLSIDTSGKAFAHVANELDYPGLLTIGAGKTKAEKMAVRRVQEWLNIHDVVTSIDESFGDSTADQLRAFQARNGRQPTGELDAETWALLTAPMRRALAGIDHGSSSLEDAVIRVARQHIAEKPVEVGGNNRGPWVRLYMQGLEGSDQLWCAGFVCLMVAQAARDLGTDMPFRRQVGVDALVKDAKNSMRFIPERDVTDPVVRKSKLRPGRLFVVRASASDWTHVGIVLAINDKSFDTLEGNTGGDGGTDGANARQGNRSYASKDFLRIV